MTALLALVSALVIGASDFTGGLATRGDNTFRVSATAQIASATTALGFAMAIPAGAVTHTDVVAGVVAGLSATFSLACFYRALSIGVMSVVAPTTALVSATIPACLGIVRGDRLDIVTVLGLATAGAAILLVAREPAGSDGQRASSRSAFVLAVIAGIGFAVFFIALAETDEAAGVWPLVIARFVSVPIVALIAWRVAGAVVPRERSAVRLAVFTGVAEMVANAILLVALRRGPIAVASVFGSLYPVSTVLLARVVLHERVARMQFVGIGLALGALVLVAI